MGLERLLMVVQGQASVFGCDVFQPWTTALTGLWQPDQRSLRLLTDHLRSSIVVIGDGVTPSNTGRGYVLRRLLRRALTVLWRPDSTRTLDDLPASLVEQTLSQFGQHEEATGSARCSAARNAGSRACSPAAARCWPSSALAGH